MGIVDIHSRLDELDRLIREWPGLVSRSQREHGAGLVEDGLVLLDHLGPIRTLVDVGSGAGLPGLPLKIARPDLQVTLIESNKDKAAFLVHACAALRLDGVTVVARRAEEAARLPDLREAFDVAVARALAPMPVLVELCLPFVKVGGRFLAQKTSAEDLEAAAHAIELLGGSLTAVHDAPSSARVQGTVVEIEKVVATPATYPRRIGVPSRKPLG
jgi:16S rRNA (guanine527-N7)-methyltransferase